MTILCFALLFIFVSPRLNDGGQTRWEQNPGFEFTCRGPLLRTEDWDFLSMMIEDMTHLNMRKWRHKNIKLIKIEDEEICKTLFNSNYIGACLNKLCTVILVGGFRYAENFSVTTLKTVLGTWIEGFVLGVWGSQIFTLRIVSTNFGW